MDISSGELIIIGLLIVIIAYWAASTELRLHALENPRYNTKAGQEIRELQETQLFKMGNADYLLQKAFELEQQEANIRAVRISLQEQAHEKLQAQQDQVAKLRNGK